MLAESPNSYVPYYLMASYLYYEWDISLISDGLYDEICKYLDANWDKIEHWHKHLVDREALRAGTGFQIDFSNLPSRITGAATHLAKGCGYVLVKK